MEALRPLALARAARTGASSPAALLLTHPSAVRQRRRNLSTTTPLPRESTQRTKRLLNIAPHTSFLASSNQDRTEIIYNPPSSAPSVYNTPFKFLPKSDPRRREALASHLFADPTNPIPKPSDVLHAMSSPSPSSFPSKAAAARATSRASSGLPPSSSSSSDDANSPANTAKLASILAEAESDLPPPSRADELLSPKHHLTPADVAEIRRLRLANPRKWSVMKLADRFQCAETFVMACVQAPDQHQRQLRQKAEKAKERWGSLRREAHEERVKRRRMLMRGEI